jgi:protein-tyrosine phosphatase
MDYANEIFDGVWLGSKHAEPNNPGCFDVVITALSPEEVIYFKVKSSAERWIWIPIKDDEEERILSNFLHVAHEIEAARKANKRVLVHCAAGVSRSATLMIAYTMWKLGLNRREAFEHVSKQRKCIDPNDGFMNQLLEFENVLQVLYEMDGQVTYKAAE